MPMASVVQTASMKDISVIAAVYPSEQLAPLAVVQVQSVTGASFIEVEG